MRLEKWLQHREKDLSDRWIQELRTGRDPGDSDGLEILEIVARKLISFLPPCFGERREVAREVWQHAAHLYGSLALLRGLAAGEVVDELQLLREVLLKLFLSDFSADGGSYEEHIPPTEFLTLNRVLDQGVSRASISYVDDLFFTHLQGTGVPKGLDDEKKAEIERQLESLRRDLYG